MPRKDPIERREYARRYAREHAEEAKARTKAYHEEHKGEPEYERKRQEASMRWKRENRGRYLAWRNKRAKERLENDPVYRAQRHAQQARYRAQRLPMIRQIIAESKACGCLFCQELELACLDFHHVDPAAKGFQITPLQILHKTPTALRDEIAKCVVLCANCHRKLHAGLIALSIT